MKEILVIVYFVFASVQCAPPAEPKIYLDTPTVHCNPICSCRVANSYYSEGEQWANPDDPCTVYRCSKEGLIETVKTGCLYKGTCHSVNITWSEGCNTFTCIENANTTIYKLIEAGCPAPDGGCLNLGERKNIGCDLLECQIDGHHLAVKTIRKDCSVNGACKRLDSFWHDGCTIFTCANENNTVDTRTRMNEVMLWPEGNYALLKPKTGCPTDIPKAWSEGSRKHHGTGRNRFSKPLFLAGKYATKYMRHDFCIHGTNTESAAVPRYKTYWEPGKYCILRRGGNCPRDDVACLSQIQEISVQTDTLTSDHSFTWDNYPSVCFSDGYVAFADNIARSKSVSSGILPDGNFTTKTGLHFCCRKDGDVLAAIVLPKDEGFVLFIEGGETKCQAVKGMSSSVAFFTFGGKPGSKHEKRGRVPHAKISKGDLTVKYCIYKPRDCGCLDNSGQSIEVNTEKIIDCVLKRCVSKNGKNVLGIVSGGCSVDGKCQPEGTKWSINEGDTCRVRTCEKAFVGSVEGADVSFQVTEGFPGCRDGEECINVGEEIRRDCYTRQCMKDAATNNVALKVKKADCPWLDTCKAPNSTWEYNCMTYRCDMNTESGQYRWNVQPVQYGCTDGKGNCYSVGQNVSGQCFEAVCQLNENKTVVFLDVTKRGCAGKGGCRAVNDTWGDGCHRFKCEWRDTQSGFTAVVNATNVSCEWNGTCYSEDEVWSDGCIKYKCAVSRVSGTVNWSVKTLSLACKDRTGNCLAVDKEIVDNCVTYRCMLRGDQLGLNPVLVGCKWNNTCYSENEKWSDAPNCVDYQCLKQTLPMGPVMQVSALYGCVFNKTCKPENSTWSDGCKTRKCEVYRQAKMIQRSIAPISAGCDDEGICRNVGYKKMTDTCMEYECIFNETYKDSFFSLTGGGCRSADGKCHDVGRRWTEKRTNTCLEFECHKEHIGYLSKMIEQKCLDANGKCQAAGSSGFQASVKGKLGTDCMCMAAPSAGDGIAIRCKG